MINRLAHVVKVIINNVLMIPYKITHNIALSSILQDSSVDIHSKIYGNSKFYRSTIGKWSYIGANSFVSDTDIGNFTSISTECYIGGAAHPLDRISTSYHFYCTVLQEDGKKLPFYRYYYNAFRRTKIGNDVWIGEGVHIKAGVEIADGAVIGTSSMVTQNVGPYEIWAGNPARFIRKRFNDNQIEQLIKSNWWDCGDEEIIRLSEKFNDINKFFEEVN